MAHQQPIRNKSGTGTRDAREIPDKLYFRIGEVAKLCAVPAYVLRFWETEFPQLKPNKGGTGQRLYRRRDVEMALRVKTLLYDQGYTIAGARQAFKSEPKNQAGNPAQQPASLPEAATTSASVKKLQTLRAEMQGLLDMLSKPVASRPGVAPVQSIRSVRGRRSESGLLFADVLPERDV